jgi:hypothetical protein
MIAKEGDAILNTRTISFSMAAGIRPSALSTAISTDMTDPRMKVDQYPSHRVQIMRHPCGFVSGSRIWTACASKALRHPARQRNEK